MFSKDLGINLRQEEILLQNRSNNNVSAGMRQRVNSNNEMPSKMPANNFRNVVNNVVQTNVHQEQDRIEPQNIQYPVYVLYVWENEKNSERALHVAKNTIASNMVTVVDVKQMHKNDLSEWLVGVPTLLNTNAKEVFRGTKCLDELFYMDKWLSRENEKKKEELQGNTFMRRGEKQENINTFPMLPQPQMRRVQDEKEADVSSLPSFKEPENETEEEKENLKKQVEAIMARREALVGSKDN